MRGLRSAVMVALVVGAGSGAWADDAGYSGWQPSTEYQGFEYRVKHVRINEFRVKDGKSAHDWCLQIHNVNRAKVSFRYAITDPATEAPAKDKWGSADVEPGQVKESCINFIDTPEGGNPRVWLDKVVIDGKLVPPACDPGAVTVSRIGKNSKLEVQFIQIIRPDGERATLSRSSLVMLSKQPQPPATAPIAGDGVPAAKEEVFELYGAGSPKLTLTQLARAFCAEKSPSTFSARALGQLSNQLKDKLVKATEALCARDKNPARCMEKLKKKTPTSEGRR